MEKFLNRIKKFTELLNFLFDALVKKFHLLFLSVFIITLIEVVVLFLINNQWIGFFTKNLENGSWETGKMTPFLMIVSGVFFFFMEVWKFSALSSIRNGGNKLGNALAKGFIATVRISMLTAFLSSIFIGFMMLERSPILIVLLFGMMVYFLILLSSYISLYENKKGVEAFMRAMHVWRKNFFKSLWKIFIFSVTFFLIFIAFIFFLSLLVVGLIQSIMISFSYILGLSLGLLIAIVLTSLLGILFYLYFSLLSENIWKIRKYVAFYKPNYLFIISVYVFLSVILYIVILGLTILSW